MNRSKPMNLAVAAAPAPSPMRAIARTIRELRGHATGSPALSLIGSMTMLLTTTAWSAPTGGVVSAGQARIAHGGTLTNVAQTSNRAVIDWQGFSVAANESVNFQQPSATAVTLNRVTGSDPSSILGHITANGSVFLVNPNGIVFGQGSTVDVSGLVAATANISNTNFMAGTYRFDEAGSASAKVQNLGTIRIANAGIAALVGRQVSNAGFISAKLGKVALVGGDTFVLDLGADHLVSLILDPAAMEQVVDANGVPLAARVDNTGAITAAGGRVEISADTVSHLLDNVINIQGDIRATSVQSHDGTISLTGGASTDVTLGGVLQSGGQGGLVAVAGRDITIAPTAQIDLGSGAPLQLNALRNLQMDAPLNGLYDGAAAGGSLSATAGNNLEISQSIATNDGALTLSAGGTLSAASGTTLQSGSQALSLSGAAGVSADHLVSQGAVAITSSAGPVSVASAIVAPSTGTDAAPVATLSVQAQQGITLHGALASGDITLHGNGDLALLDSPVQSVGGNLAVQAGGAINLAAAVITAGDLSLSSGGTLTSAQVLGGPAGGTSHAITIDAGGAVTLAGANAGAGGIAITGRGGDVVSPGATGGLVSSGGVTVDVIAGQAGTSAAPLTISAGDGTGAAGVAGGASVSGRDGVSIGSLVTPGAVLLRSDQGNVVAGSAIAGSAASALADASPVRQLDVQAAGDVTLAGARVGSVSVTGATSGSGAGSFSLSGGALLSDGDVAVTTSGAIQLNALVQSAGNVTMASTAGALTVGNAGISVTGAGHGLSLTAGTDLLLNGDLAIKSGTIALASTGGTVKAFVTTPGANPVDADATIDAGTDAASQVTVAAQGDVALGDIRAGGGATISSAAGNVQLLSPIGGQNTGYMFYDNGYQASLRPTLGTLAISAPGGSVELNGLNLDGLADPVAGTGLSVVAGHMILSNETIAVNKGDIVLQGGTTGTDGVYLGSSVFSRGWDSVGSDGHRGGTGTAADVKVGYGISITGHNLGLFDNNIDVATLPGLYVAVLADGSSVLTDAQGYVVDKNGQRTTPGQRVITDGSVATPVATLAPADTATDDQAVVGQPISRTVDKIEISNNVANYQDDPGTAAGLTARQTLVPVSSATIPVVNVNVDLVGGVFNSVVNGDGGLAGRQSLAGFAPDLRSLSQAPIVVTPSTTGGATVGSTRGIALKLLGFEAPGDSATQIWSDGIAFGEVSTTVTQLDPTQAYGASAVFGDGQSATGGLFSAAGPLPVIAAPVGGQISFTVPGDFVLADGSACSICSATSATYHLQLLSGVSPVNGLPLNGFAKVISIDVVVDAQGHTSPGHPADTTDGSSLPTNASDVGRTLQIRFAGNPGVSVAGSSSGAQLQGTLISASGGTDIASLSAGPSLAVVNTPGFVQEPNGTITASVVNSGSFVAPVGYTLGRVIVDSSTSGTFSASQSGTRLLVFDGILDSGVAHGSGDSTGGANFVPGFSGISGNNNSTTGFSSVNASVGSSSGTSQGAATGTTSGSISASTGVSPGTTFVAAPSVPADAGGPIVTTVDTSHVEASAQDAAQSPQAGATTVQAEPAAQPIEIGVSPASQADLGRSGGVSGAATNVFRRGYRVASSTDAQVCAPGVIESSGTDPGGQGGGRTCGAGGNGQAGKSEPSH